MTVYQQCPFCERVFEIGPEEHEPMKRHIHLIHRDSTGSGGETTTADDPPARHLPPQPAR